MSWSRLPTSDGDANLTPPVALSTVLDSVLAGLGAPSTDAIVAVHDRWDEVVGEELAARSRPIAIEGAVLRVGVDSAAWAGHLRWSEREILERLDRLVGPGTVTSVRTKVARS